MDKSFADFKKWPEPALKFIFSQAESELKHSIEVSRKLTDRAHFIFNISITLSVITLGYLIKSWQDNFEALDFIAINCTVIFFICLILAIIIIYPKNLMPAGRAPIDLLNEGLFLNPNYSKDDTVNALMMAEIKSYQSRIEFNEKRNKFRLTLMKLILGLLISVFPITVVIISFWDQLSQFLQ